MRSKVVELDVEQLKSDLDQMQQVMGEDTSRRFRTLLSAYTSLLQLIQEKDISASRLRRMLFGARTERTRDVSGTRDSTSPAASPTGHG
jgi:hypothetical protein